MCSVEELMSSAFRCSAIMLGEFRIAFSDTGKIGDSYKDITYLGGSLSLKAFAGRTKVLILHS